MGLPKVTERHGLVDGDILPLDETLLDYFSQIEYDARHFSTAPAIVSAPFSVIDRSLVFPEQTLEWFLNDLSVHNVKEFLAFDSVKTHLEDLVARNQVQNGQARLVYSKRKRGDVPRGLMAYTLDRSDDTIRTITFLSFGTYDLRKPLDGSFADFPKFLHAAQEATDQRAYAGALLLNDRLTVFGSTLGPVFFLSEEHFKPMLLVPDPQLAVPGKGYDFVLDTASLFLDIPVVKARISHDLCMHAHECFVLDGYALRPVRAIDGKEYGTSTFFDAILPAYSCYLGDRFIEHKRRAMIAPGS